MFNWRTRIVQSDPKVQSSHLAVYKINQLPVSIQRVCNSDNMRRGIEDKKNGLFTARQVRNMILQKHYSSQQTSKQSRVFIWAAPVPVCIFPLHPCQRRNAQMLTNHCGKLPFGTFQGKTGQCDTHDRFVFHVDWVHKIPKS